ncbi:amidohydrolase family protein [Pseudonocardia xishanensis]|uniref:Amidohydrolase n=1 Tax=Pseudonocardia xishanensis TaxID=630995 RepID=A0ABP8RVY3_9PSEU
MTEPRSERGARVVDTIVHSISRLITVDERRRVIHDAAVAIDGGVIVAVGQTPEVLTAFTSDQRIDATDRVATPGLIDCHLHSSFQLSRGLADEANAREFLVQRMYPYEAALTNDDVRLSSRMAAREMLLHGTTTYVDPGNAHPAETVAGVGPSGIRAVIAASAFDLGGSDFGAVPAELVASPDIAAERAAGLFRDFEGAHDDRVRVSVSFRGLNNSSDDLIRALDAVARDHGALLQTHACFNYSTHDSSVQKFGVPEIERLDRLGALHERTLLVHGAWLEPHEVVLIRERGANVVVNPSSSMHNGYGNIQVGHAPELLADGVTVALGSDHACSGPVDLVREMFLAACGYKEARMIPRVMPPETVVEMATINAARAIGQADRLGSVEIGKQADLVLFDATTPEWQPLFNPVSNLVYSATGSSVSTVLVGGRVVVEGGRLQLVDEAELQADLMHAIPDFAKRVGAESLTTDRWPTVS